MRSATGRTSRAPTTPAPSLNWPGKRATERINAGAVIALTNWHKCLLKYILPAMHVHLFLALSE